MGECCNSICKTYIILLSLYLCFMTSLGIICATWNGEIKNNFKTIHKRAYILEMRTVVHMQGCVQLCDPMDCSMPGFPVLHRLLEFAQTRVHWVDDAIQPSHPLSPPSPALHLSQHQGLFLWVGFSHQVAKILQLQHQPFQWIFREKTFFFF